MACVPLWCLAWVSGPLKSLEGFVYDLRVELEYFEQHREEWCKYHLNKIVVIHGTTVHGFYDTYETALEVGYDQCGTDVSFLLKQVLKEDDVVFITRLM
jgi:hypothetical protein